MEEAELERRYRQARNLPRFKGKTDEEVKRAILDKEARKAEPSGGRPVSVLTGRKKADDVFSSSVAFEDLPLDPALQLPTSWRPEFRRLMREYLDRVKDDVDIVLLKMLIENFLLKLFKERIALAMGATPRDIKELTAAIVSMSTMLGLTEARRYIRQEKGEETVLEEINKGAIRVKEDRDGRQARRDEMSAFLKSKTTESQADD